MGRRKERRLAAISAAGRRVKLDLCVEPSGDLGSSPAPDEVGGDSDSRTQSELPDSPSSSGPQVTNPLILLEQYSDDDVDDRLSGGKDAGAAKDPSSDLDDKTKVNGEITTEDIGPDSVNNYSVQVVTQLEMDDDSVSQDPLHKLEKGDNLLNDTDDLLKETNAMEGGICAVIPNEQVGDMSLSWKKVLHEESSQHYYWNILTGETSWEVPDVLAQANVYPEKAVSDASGTSVDIEHEDATADKLNKGSEVINKTSGNSSKGAEADRFGEGREGDSLGNEIGNSDASQNTSLLENAPIVNDAKHSCNLLSEECKLETDFSSHLVKHCGILLERLSSLESLTWSARWQDIKLKYKLEVEIRLSDIKTLASCGSDLLPFWLHTEDQLKRLDAAIDDAIRQYGSAPIRSQEASKVDLNEKMEKELNHADCTSELNHADCASEKSHIEAYSDVATGTGLVSSVVCPAMCSNTEADVKAKIIGREMPSEFVSKSIHDSGEEVDMDVDMEVDDTSTSLKSSASGAHFHMQSQEQSNQQNPPSVHDPLLPGQMFGVQPPATSWIHPLSLANELCPPPPPDNEPFPPPPPDDYPFPPPPPDEPPETSYPPPPHLDSVHTLPYSEHYVLAYPPSNLEYYGQSNSDISGVTLYAHPEGVQVSASHITPYYEAVPNVYAVAPLVENPGEPSSYYGLQNGSLNPPSLVSAAAVASSSIQSETFLTDRDTDSTHSLDSHPDAGYDLFPKANLSNVKSGQGSLKEPEFLDSQPTIGSQPTTSMSQGVYASSASDAQTSVSATATAAAAAVTTSKVQSKVPRSKKRTVAVVSTLRSNKKVSSLVDKWKAAKEELHEEEEEPENTYEMLERKRQREIEEWQAQQIASGEAKDNANFQPLGGDWRERVKRKRAQKMKETEHNVLEATGPEEPNLVELSRGLPSGWQAYWDDSSKKVYYGNVVTSETTWNKPKS
ncbi:formin-binding protein 4 [Dorcoceras hygrometricum]|uniref:Formin-binding protein 4 n=1 Tax=Dorcoceras hygrometricum TaxID=472368 RepID=A0A2Z7BVH3_9LAMI|nr:formin-binding protein 4 [Dorcoceras hygrometricum]